MLGFTASSYAGFAIVWSLLCVLSGALVTDSMLRHSPSASGPEPDGGVARAEADDGRLRG